MKLKIVSNVFLSKSSIKPTWGRSTEFRRLRAVGMFLSVPSDGSHDSPTVNCLFAGVKMIDIFRFTLYNDTVSQEVSCLLSHYIKQGDSPPPSPHYVTDCLARSGGSPALEAGHDLPEGDQDRGTVCGAE